jgi:hypothetical protein
VFEVTATEVGPSVKWATAKVEKVGKKPAPKPEDDPWTTEPADDETAPF